MYLLHGLDSCECVNQEENVDFQVGTYLIIHVINSKIQMKKNLESPMEILLEILVFLQGQGWVLLISTLKNSHSPLGVLFGGFALVHTLIFCDLIAGHRFEAFCCWTGWGFNSRKVFCLLSRFFHFLVGRMIAQR